MQLLLALRSGDPAYAVGDATEKSRLESKALGDLAKALSTVETHLSSRTFFVGERMTIADISFFAVVCAVLQLGANDIRRFPSAWRCCMTVGGHKSVASVAKEGLALFSNPLPPKRSEDFSGKWQRNRIRVKELLAKGVAMIGQEVTVQGWIRTTRSADRNQILFVELTDGSTVKGMQLVLNVETTEGTEAVANCGGVGASLSVTGLVVESPAK